MPEMDKARQAQGQQSAPKAWTCHECGATGTGWTLRDREAQLLAHWAANHQVVTF